MASLIDFSYLWHPVTKNCTLSVICRSFRPSVSCPPPEADKDVSSELSIYRALYPSKLDIGYCQKAGDIANLKSGYWILPTENRILGY